MVRPGVFVGTRSFTDEHQLGRGIADPEDDLGAGSDEVRALDANQGGLAQGLESPISRRLGGLTRRRRLGGGKTP